jgi:hypothetical protein
MGRKAMKESEKAQTPLSEFVLESPELVEKITILSREIQTRLEAEGESFKRVGICALRDACNVLIALGQEEDLQSGSDHLKELEAQIRSQLAEE